MVSVLVVDDSTVARRLIAHIVGSQPDLRVVGEARDGAEALTMVAALDPDVVTMDIRMPVMDGYRATTAMMSTSPRPIVMVSAHEPAEIARSFRAIDAGALMVLRKPVGFGSPDAPQIAAELVEAIRSVAGLAQPAAPRQGSDLGGRLLPRTAPVRPAPEQVELVAIAASTGGPAALGTIVRDLPATFPVPIVVVQHIAAGFDAGFASYLDSVASLGVRLARHGERPAPGTVHLAPNGTHLVVDGGGRLRLSDEPPVGGHRPSATPLFQSMAANLGPRGLGVILTGIGRDGCDGLVEFHRAGGHVIAQDEMTSVVWGMPRAVIEAEAADEILAIEELAGAILRSCRRGRNAA